MIVRTGFREHPVQQRIFLTIRSVIFGFENQLSKCIMGWIITGTLRSVNFGFENQKFHFIPELSVLYNSIGWIIIFVICGHGSMILHRNYHFL